MWKAQQFEHRVFVAADRNVLCVLSTVEHGHDDLDLDDVGCVESFDGFVAAVS